MVYIGLSGYIYQHWKGAFYPQGLAQRHWLSYCAQFFNTVELNGTFYSLKWPSVFRKWLTQVPPSFVFALKGSRYITHNLKLKNHERAMANFLASGILALGRQTGPFLWQLPPNLGFHEERIENFLQGLPRTSAEAAILAEGHDERLKRGSLTEPAADVVYRHCMEVRHPSFVNERFFNLLRKYDCAFVIADTAGRFVYAEETTCDWVYVRLHGSQQLYVSQYSDAELDEWAARIRRWQGEKKDVYVYFDNDARAHAPFDALRLRQRVEGPRAIPEHPGADFQGRMSA